MNLAKSCVLVVVTICELLMSGVFLFLPGVKQMLASSGNCSGLNYPWDQLRRGDEGDIYLGFNKTQMFA